MAAPAPNFFLVGAAKSGTTSLHAWLGQHPSIYMSPIKEPHYFADEIRPENFSPEMKAKIDQRAPALRAWLDGSMLGTFSGGPICHYQDYLRLFRHATTNHLALGESSPCYLWSPTAPANIARHFPHAKILMILRDPAARAFAQYAHMLMFAPRELTFRDYLDHALSSTETKISEIFPFLQFGFYGRQIERYRRFFPAERIGIWFHEDLNQDPVRVTSQMFEFLGVAPSVSLDFSQRHMQATVPRSFALNRTLRLLPLRFSMLPAPVRRMAKIAIYRDRQSLKISSRDRQFLIDYYREDIRLVESLTGRDLSHWLL